MNKDLYLIAFSLLLLFLAGMAGYHTAKVKFHKPVIVATDTVRLPADTVIIPGKVIVLASESKGVIDTVRILREGDSTGQGKDTIQLISAKTDTLLVSSEMDSIRVTAEYNFPPVNRFKLDVELKKQEKFIYQTEYITRNVINEVIVEKMPLFSLGLQVGIGSVFGPGLSKELNQGIFDLLRFYIGIGVQVNILKLF